MTSDFSPSGGPSVASSATTGNTLSYTCSADGPATPCGTAQTASTTSATPVASFGANARSAKAGNSAALAWTLINDPQYETGTYQAVVTFEISVI